MNLQFDRRFLTSSIVFVVIVLWFFLGIPMRFGTNFATQARLRGDIDGRSISVDISDPSDVQTLKRMMNRMSYGGRGYRHRDNYVQIILTDGEQFQSYDVAPDGDRRVDLALRKWFYLSRKERNQLDGIFLKYGVIR